MFCEETDIFHHITFGTHSFLKKNNQQKNLKWGIINRKG